MNILQNSLISIDICKNILFNIDTGINIFKNGHINIDIDIDIFQTVLIDIDIHIERSPNAANNLQIKELGGCMCKVGKWWRRLVQAKLAHQRLDSPMIGCERTETVNE